MARADVILREARKVHQTLPRYVDGYCAVASAQLYYRLLRKGIAAVFLVVDEPEFSHVFLKVPGGRLLDVTSSQFDPTQSIELRCLRGLDTKKFWWWHEPHEVATPEELLQLQEDAEWPKEQLVKLECV